MNNDFYKLLILRAHLEPRFSNVVNAMFAAISDAWSRDTGNCYRRRHLWVKLSDDPDI